MDEKKSDSVENTLEAMGILASGRSRQASKLFGLCLFCGKQVKEFRDPLSAKEYEISGLCQVCQDEMFGEEEE